MNTTSSGGVGKFVRIDDIKDIDPKDYRSHGIMLLGSIDHANSKHVSGVALELFLRMLLVYHEGDFISQVISVLDPKGQDDGSKGFSKTHFLYGLVVSQEMNFVGSTGVTIHDQDKVMDLVAVFNDSKLYDDKRSLFILLVPKCLLPGVK